MISQRTNLYFYSIFAILRGAAVSVSIVLWVIFMQQHYGFSMTEVTLLDLPFWAGKFIFEIPTGVVADRFGRKLSLAISSGLSAVIWMVFSLVGNFWLLVLAQFIGALAATFSSGADEALLYESVRGLGREDEYARISGRMRAIEVIASMLAGVGVGLLATVDLVLPVRLASLLIALQIIPVICMKETIQPAAEARSHSAEPYLQTVRRAFGLLREIPAVRWAVTYQVVLGCVAFYASAFFQPFALEAGMGLALIGPLTMLLQLAGVAGSLSVARLQEKLGSLRLLYAAALLVAPGLALVGAARLLHGPGAAGGAGLWLSSLCFTTFLFSMTQPLLLAVLQAQVANEVRATLLSIQSLLSTVFLIVTEPGLGVLADRFGFHSAYLGMAGLTALVLFFVHCKVKPGREIPG